MHTHPLTALTLASKECQSNEAVERGGKYRSTKVRTFPIYDKKGHGDLLLSCLPVSGLVPARCGTLQNFPGHHDLFDY